VRIVYGPPGFSGNVRSLLEHGPHRHYHRSVTERHYVLAGDYPIWHWTDATRAGEMTRLRRHHYLENPPGTLHGIMPGSVPETGYGIVHWTDGFGTELFEPGAETETITVEPDVTVNPSGLRSPVLFHAEELPWSTHGSVSDWRVRELGVETPTCAPARLVNIPPGVPVSANHAPLAGPRWQWLLVISGDLRMRATDTGNATAPGAAEPVANGAVVSLREGSFLAWRPGSNVQIDREQPSIGGCVALCVGHDLATAAQTAARA
jgi:hypothetical protein